MTLQEQMIKAMDEADKYSNKPFLREDAAKVCAEIAELYARAKWDEACLEILTKLPEGIYLPKPAFKP